MGDWRNRADRAREATRTRHPTHRDVHGEVAPPEGCPSSYLLLRAEPCVQVIALDRYWDHDHGRRTTTGELVYRAKYEGSGTALERVLTFLGYWLGCIPGHRQQFARFDGVVAIPSRWGGEAYSGRLGRACAEASSAQLRIPLLEEVLRERTERPSLKGLPAERHADEMSGAFEANRPVHGALLLVDDLVQTGATLSAGAQALLDAGASSVWGLALARVHSGMTV